MKPRARKLLACLWAALICQPMFAADSTPPPLGEETPAATATVTPAATAKPAKKAKPPRDPNATPRPPKSKKPKEINFPVPIGEPASNVDLPDYNLTGELLMLLKSLKMTRISNELVQMEESNLNFKQPDGKEDFQVILPKSVFNLQTRVVHSDDPITVRTQDFELTGDKMEFNTVDRTGTLIGHVHMTIHNLKQVAGPQAPNP